MHPEPTVANTRQAFRRVPLAIRAAAQVQLTTVDPWEAIAGSACRHSSGICHSVAVAAFGPRMRLVGERCSPREGPTAGYRQGRIDSAGQPGTQNSFRLPHGCRSTSGGDACFDLAQPAAKRSPLWPKPRYGMGNSNRSSRRWHAAVLPIIGIKPPRLDSLTRLRPRMAWREISRRHWPHRRRFSPPARSVAERGQAIRATIATPVGVSLPRSCDRTAGDAEFFPRLPHRGPVTRRGPYAPRGDAATGFATTASWPRRRPAARRRGGRMSTVTSAATESEIIPALLLDVHSSIG